MWATHGDPHAWADAWEACRQVMLPLHQRRSRRFVFLTIVTRGPCLGPLPLVGVSIRMERGCQQNDRTLADAAQVGLHTQRERHAPPFLTLVAVFPCCLSASGNQGGRSNTARAAGSRGCRPRHQRSTAGARPGDIPAPLFCWHPLSSPIETPTNVRGGCSILASSDPQVRGGQLVDQPAPRRREFGHFADTHSPSVLKRLLKGEGGAAEWRSRRRRGQTRPRRPHSAPHRLQWKAVGEAVILLHLPLPYSRRFNTDGKGVAVK